MAWKASQAAAWQPLGSNIALSSPDLPPSTWNDASEPEMLLFVFLTVQGILICPELRHLHGWQVHCDGLRWQEGHSVWSDLLRAERFGCRARSPRSGPARSSSVDSAPLTDSVDVACGPPHGRTARRFGSARPRWIFFWPHLPDVVTFGSALPHSSN